MPEDRQRVERSTAHHHGIQVWACWIRGTNGVEHVSVAVWRSDQFTIEEAQ